MKTTNYFLSLLMLTCSYTIASAQSISYSKVEDDPYKNNFHLDLIGFSADYSAHQSIMLGFGISGNVAIKQIASFDFCYDKPYGGATDFNYHFATETAFGVVTTNVPKHYSHFEIGGMYHLVDHERTKSVKVVLSSSSSSSGRMEKTSVTYVMIPASTRQIFGIRGGLYHNAMPINDRDHGTASAALSGEGNGGVVADDGTEFGTAVSSFDSPFYNTKAVTNLSVNGFYAGICKSKTVNLTIDADYYGKCSTKKTSRIYADIILASPSIEDFHATNGKDYKVSGGNAKGFETRSLGWRVGYDVVSSGNAVGLYYKIELGTKPGLANSKFFMGVGFGMSIKGKIKPIAAG